MANRLIPGQTPFHQFMEGEGSFLLPYAPAFFRLLRALDAPEYMDYDFVMAVSGAAARLSWQPGWAGYDDLPNQASLLVDGDLLAEYRRGFAGAGLDCEICICEERTFWPEGSFTGPVTRKDAAAARRDVIASIDAGVPVLAEGGEEEFPITSLIIGYFDDGESVALQHLFMNQDRPEPVEYLRIGPGWEKRLAMYCNLRSFRPRPVDAGLLRAVFRRVIELARMPDVNGAACGVRAFDALAEQLVWDDGFKELPLRESHAGPLSWPFERPPGFYREDAARNLHGRFFGYCDFLCLLNGYGNLARFLDRYRDIVPGWSETLKKAAAEADRACHYSGALWNYVTFDDAGVEKFRGDDIRSIFAAHMLRAKIHTLRLAELLEQLSGE